MQLAKPVPSQKLTAEQMGRLTYLSVCTGCHSYTHIIVGLPMIAIQAKYKDNPEALVEYVTQPQKNWPGYPEMPSQGYLSDEALKVVADYIVYELKE